MAIPRRTPATMKPMPANSCSRPSIAWRSSDEAWPRRDDVGAATGAALAGGRLAVVVVFDRFLGWPQVVIEIPTVPRGCCGDGASRFGSSVRVHRLPRCIGADDHDQRASLPGCRDDAVLNRACLATLDEEQIEAREGNLGLHLREHRVLV